MGALETRNKEEVQRHWDPLAERDRDSMKGLLTNDAHYTDVGVPGPGGIGKICRWHDYSNIGNITDNAPAWWLEHIVEASTEG